MPTNYYDPTGKVAGTECSSTNEGRYLQFAESVLTHPTHTDGFVDPKDPIVYGQIVGVAVNGAAAATDIVIVDTEGIYWLNVTATDEDGNIAVAIGDELYINRTTAVLSKSPIGQPFGYALSILATGTTGVVPVKVHFDESDSLEVVGSEAAPWVSTKASMKFREYRYEASSATGDHRGQYLALTMSGAGASGEAIRGRTIGTAALAGGVHGGHFGVELGTGGSITGLGVGCRGTFMGPNRSVIGTVCGGMSELWAEGTATDWAGGTHSIHRFVNGGDGTGAATAINVFEFAGLTATQFPSTTRTTIDHALRIIVNGVMYYIGCYNSLT